MEDGKDPNTEPNDKVVVEPAVDPLRGLKKANKTLTRERDEIKTKLETLEREAAQAKLTDAERTAASLKQLAKERDDALAEREAAKREREQERRISQMVAKHGLRDPEFGDIILKQFNPEEHDDFDKFVATTKRNQKYSVLFGVPGDDRILDDDGEEIVPQAPRQGSNKGKVVNNTEHEDFARRMFPGNAAQQQAYLANVNAMGRGR